MKQKLHKELQALLDFYHKARQNLPEAFTYKAGVINKPSFFTVADLQRHLNNPLLHPDWLYIKQDGERVDIKKSVFFKSVQNKELNFIDKVFFGADRITDNDLVKGHF